MIRELIVALLLIQGALLGETWHGIDPKGFSAESTISTPKISVLEPLSVELSLAYPKDYHVDLEILKAHLLRHNPLKPPPFKLISAVADQPSETDGVITQKVHYHLQPQLPGDFSLSFLNIDFVSNDPKDPPVKLVSDLFDVTVSMVPLEDPFAITVGPMLRLSEQFPINISPKNRKNLMGRESSKMAAQYNQEVFEEIAFPWWILILIAAVVLVTWAVKESVEEQARRRPSDQERKQRAEEQALAALNQIEQNARQQKEQFMQFYIDLTDTVRKYIEEKYQLHAPTLTTQEFLKAASVYPGFDDEMRNRLTKYLISADRVKFSQYHPSTEESLQAFQDAKEVIVRGAGQ